MKLRNKLIPLATVFATSATLAPVVLTSCSGGMVDLTNGGYKPTVEKAKNTGSSVNTDTAFEIYITAVNNNPEILKQDLLWSSCHYYKTIDDINGYKTTSLKASVNNIKVGYQTIKINEEDTKVPVISYTMSLVHDCNYYYEDEQYGQGHQYISHKFDVEMNNIPYGYNSDVYWQYAPATDWIFGPKADRLLNFDEAELDWSFKFSETWDDKFVYTWNGQEYTVPEYKTSNLSFSDYYTLIGTYYGLIPVVYDTGSGKTTTVWENWYFSDLLNNTYFYSHYLSDITKA